MTDRIRKPRRVVTARRTLAMGTVAVTALGSAAESGVMPHGGNSLQEPIVLAQAEAEGEGGTASGEGATSAGSDPCIVAAASGGEGEGEGAVSSGGEGEGEASSGDGEGAVSPGGEGEGEASSGDGEGEVSSGGEGEGESSASSGGEGEGAAASGGEGDSSAASGGEGEGEGEGAAPSADAEMCMLRDLGVIEANILAGLELYETGDAAAAQGHLTDVVREDYAPVEAALEQRGLDRLRDELGALAEAAEADAPLDELKDKADTVRATIGEARGSAPAATRIKAFAALTRLAADEYAEGVENGAVTELAEYQEAWGMLQVVRSESGKLAKSPEPEIARAAQTVLDQVTVTDDVFGDLQGEGTFEPDASVLYGAAARMDLAALGLK